MTEKSEIIKQLNEAIIIENSVVIYSNHLKAITFWSGLKKPDKEKLKKNLDLLINESSNHKTMFQSLIEKIKQDKEISGEKNVH